MKLSGLIDTLLHFKAVHGDLDIFLAGEMGWDEVSEVEVQIADNEVPWNAGDVHPGGPQPRAEALAVGTKFLGII